MIHKEAESGVEMLIGYRQMVRWSAELADRQGRLFHDVPTKSMRRRMAGKVISILQSCAGEGDCSHCRVEAECVEFYDAHFCHDMEGD